ncbi:MAG: phospholipid carrier-dependent glycosyltransferase [bacterium]
MLELFTAGWLILIAYLLGDRILRLFRLNPASFTLRFAFATGLGFGIFAYLILFLGLISCLYPWLIALIMLAITVMLFYTKRLPISEIFRKRGPFHFFRFIISKSMLLVVILIVVILNLLGALTPEVRHDSLQYHQTIPHYFLLEHRIAEVPYTIYYTYALNAEMIYTLGQAMVDGNSIIPKLFHALAAILTAIAVYGFTRKHTENPLIAMLAAAIFYTLPQVSWMSSSAFNENWWMLFGVLAIFAWFEWQQVPALKIEEENVINYDQNETNQVWEVSPKTNRNRWLYLAAVFCGLGISTKLIAVMFYPFLLGIATLIRSQKSEVRSQKYDAVFLFLAASFFLVVPVFPWLVRNYVYTHNPIYPLLSRFFTSPHPYDIAGQNFASIRSLPPMSFGAIIDRIWNSFISININGNGIITAFFIVCIPLLFIKQISRQIKWLTGYGLIAWLIYAVVEGGSDGRFIYPTYPILAIVISYALVLAIERISQFQPRSMLLRPTFFIFLLCLIMLATFIHMKIAFVQDFKESWIPVLGKQHQADYLEDHIKIYPMFEYLNTNLPENTKVLLPGGYAALYCDRRYLASSEFDISPLDDLVARHYTADQIYTQLHDWSITHLVFPATPTRDSVISDLLAKYGTKITEVNGYELYTIK